MIQARNIIPLSRGIVCMLICLALTTHDALGQDILGFFVPGNSEQRMLGGNLFSCSTSEEYMSPRGGDAILPSVNYEFSIDDLYREERGNEIINEVRKYSSNLELTIPLRSNQHASLFHLSYGRSNFLSSMAQDTNDRGSYLNRSNRFALSYLIRLSRVLSIGGEVTQTTDGNHSFANASGIMAIEAGEQSLISVKAGNTSSLNLLQLNITGVDGVLPLHFQNHGFTISASTKWNQSAISTLYEHSSITSIPGATETEATRFVPHGSLEKASFDIQTKMNTTFETLLGGSLQFVNGSGDFLSSEMTYGIIPSFDFDDKEFHSGIRFMFNPRSFIMGDLQWRKIRGQLEGHVESWPFVSIFESLISTREYFTGNGSIEYAKAHLGSLIPLSEKFSVGIGTSYMHLLPTLHIETWQPKYFIFGVRAYHERSLDIQSIDLIILSSGVNGRLGNFEGSYSITQFAPLHVNRIGGEIVSSGDQTSQGTVLDQPYKTSGGQFHQFNLTYNF
jgi:hypothetical protein